ncbi:MAG: hypothetical protein J5711_04315 [Bacteroidales bacterium]|nr:hypothetical protein [Bacteroidales bacterium]
MLDEKNIYTNEFFIESYFCDWTDHLSMWGLSRLLQTVAEEHTTLTHICYYDLIKNQKAWVLSRMYYEVDTMPAYGTRVKIATWSRGVDGLFDVRDFLVTTLDGERLAGATAFWVVIDVNTRHVARLNDIMDGYIHNDICATQKERLTKLRMLPMDESCKVEQFNVKPSMLDHTGHVNNCEYIRWVDDNLPEGKRIKTIEVAYVAETRPGESVEIRRCQPTDDTAQYQIYNTRGSSFSAIVTLESR